MIVFGVIVVVVFIWCFIDARNEAKEKEKQRKYFADQAQLKVKRESEQKARFKIAFEARRLKLEMQEGRTFSDVEVHNILTEEAWKIRESLR